MDTELDLARLRADLTGDAVGPDHPDYDDARSVWNGVIDKRPAVVVRAANVEDVVAAVGFAREHGLPVTARGGGHNVAGLAVADGAVVIELAALNRVTVDPERRIARAGGGATIAALDAATQAHGLATPMGLVSETGIAGLTLSGGMGWLRRKHGLSCDQLIGAEVVTADGRVLNVSESEHDDLLWGLRGGGGGLGVVTAFEYRLFPVGPEVFLAAVFYPASVAATGFRAVWDYTRSVGDDVSPVAFHGTVPDGDPFPEAFRGEPAFIAAALYPGDPEEGERILQPLRELGEPVLDISGRMPYAEVQKLFDEDYPNGMRYYWKSIHLTELGDEVIERLAAHAATAPSKLSTVDVWFQGGAMARVGATDTAIGDRTSPILIGAEGNWTDPADDAANIAWVRGIIQDLERFPSGGTYLNFPGFLEEGDRLLQASYGPNYQRLTELKSTYDPGGVFQGHRAVTA
jgi:FAD/FMN-containing dehydrogenase